MDTGIEVLVDSGQLMLIDPCYVLDGEKYTEACKRTIETDEGYGEFEGGIVFGTTWGDGRYKVYKELNEAGRVARITVDMDPQEEDDWDDDDY
jgi:hypothetical protein